MEYVKDVLGYYFKNFLYLLVFAIGPAVFLGLLFKPFGMYEFVYNYHSLTLYTFGDFFGAVFGFDWWSILYFFVGLIIFVVCISLLLGFIESHFRYGAPSLKNSFSLNNNILGVAKGTLALFILTFLANVLAVVLMYFVHSLGASAGVGSAFANVFVVVVAFALLFLYGRGYTLFTYATISCLLEGSPLLVGLSNGIRAMAPKTKQLILLELITFGLCFIIMLITSVLNVALIGSILSCLIFIPLICINGMMLFFETNHFDRKDKLKYYQRK